MNGGGSRAEALLGTWKMLSWYREFLDTGEKIDALGPDPVGYISYGPDGRVMTLITGKDRKAPAGSVPTDDEKLHLFDTMLAYAGSYTLDEEKVVHRPDASWNQTWTGTDQVRFYKLDGNTLTISGAPAPDPYTGRPIIHRIVFQKLESGLPASN
jgi:hypothetical protein